MATFESVSAASDSGAGNTQPSATMSASAVAGSYALCAVQGGGGALAPLSISSGSGNPWEFIGGFPHATISWMSLWGKVVETADIGSAVNVTNQGNGHWDCAVLTYSSCDGVDQIAWTPQTAPSTTVSPVGVAPTFDSQTIVSIVGTSNTTAAATITTPSTSYSKRYDDSNTATTFKELFVQDRTLGAGTSLATETPSSLTCSQSVTGVRITVSLLNTGQRPGLAPQGHALPFFTRLHRQQRYGVPATAAAFTQTVSAIEAPARAVSQQITATLTRTQAPARALLAAVTARRPATVTDTGKTVTAAAATRAVTQAPARALAATVAATRPVVEAPARAQALAAAMTRAVTQAPGRILAATVSAARKATEAAATTVSAATARTQTVTAPEATTTRAAAAVTATRPVTQTPTRTTKAAPAMTSVAAQAPARRASAAVTAARTATQTPARIVKAAVTAGTRATIALVTRAAAGLAHQARAATTTTGTRSSQAGNTPRAIPTLARSLRANLTAALPLPAARSLRVQHAAAATRHATAIATGRARAQIGVLLRAAAALTIRVANIKRQGAAKPDVFYARLDGPPWAARAGESAWTAHTKGAGMYHQLAVSDTPIPVLISSKFGVDPTGDPVTFTVTDPTDAAPAQASITLAATWFTDGDGAHWAMCPCGPNSEYVPTAGAVKALYVMIGDQTNIVVGPVSIRFD